MPASLDLPTLLPEVPNRLYQQQLHYYFPAVHASVDQDSSSHKMLKLYSLTKRGQAYHMPMEIQSNFLAK